LAAYSSSDFEDAHLFDSEDISLVRDGESPYALSFSEDFVTYGVGSNPNYDH